MWYTGDLWTAHIVHNCLYLYMKGNLVECSRNVWIVCGVTCGQEGVTEGARTVTWSEYTPEYHTIYGQNILRNIARYMVRIKSSGISQQLSSFPWNILRHTRQNSFPDKQHRYGSINYLCQLEYQTTQTHIKQFSLAPAFWKFLGFLESVLHVFVCHLYVFQISVDTAKAASE